MRSTYTSHFIIYSLLLLVLNSCYALMGLKKNVDWNQETITKAAKEYNIPSEYSYVLDTLYFDYLKSYKIDNKNAVKNHLQPLQALYHDKNGNLSVFLINCYTYGFPNLNWNKNNILETFPPQQQAPLDSILPIEKHLSFIEPLNDTTIPTNQIKAQPNEIILVYWSLMMGRQSKRFIKAIQKNKTLSTHSNTVILYVNSDLVLSNYASK